MTTLRYVLAVAAILILLAVALMAVLGDRGGVSQPSPNPSATPTAPTGGPTATGATSPSPTALPSPSASLAAGFGTISGEVAYPSSSRPELEVYAFDTSDPARWYSVIAPGFDGPDTGPATSPPPDTGKRYSIQVPPGTYHVVAYIRTDTRATSGAGLYSQFVLCGLRAGCSDHTLIEVTVAAGQTRTRIDPADWYHQPGEATYPPRPTPR